MKVFVTGDFDDIKSRHIRLLEQAAKHGSLTVLLWSDEAIRKRFGREPKFPESERLYFLRALRYVSDVKLEPTVSENTLNEFPHEPAAWAVESTRDNLAKQLFCKAHGIDYRVIPDTALAGFPKSDLKPSDTHARKRVIITGCYDWFHSGHVRFFEEAAAFGDLYVGVGNDANIRLLKGQGRPLFPQDERCYITGSIRFVKQSFVSSGMGWLDAEPEMKIIQPDIYVVNEDGDVPEKREYCEKHGIEYVVLKRMPAPGLPKRSSTQLRGY